MLKLLPSELCLNPNANFSQSEHSARVLAQRLSLCWSILKDLFSCVCSCCLERLQPWVPNFKLTFCYKQKAACPFKSSICNQPSAGLFQLYLTPSHCAANLSIFAVQTETAFLFFNMKHRTTIIQSSKQKQTRVDRHIDNLVHQKTENRTQISYSKLKIFP